MTKRPYRTYNSVGPGEVISSAIIQDFVELLGHDAKCCYYGLQEFQDLDKTKIPEQFSKLFNLFGTVPVLFLSVERNTNGVIKAIYLWHINRLCPWNHAENCIEIDFIPDVRDLHACPSLLMLLKIESEEPEALVNAKLLPGGKMLVKSVVESSQVVFRIYDICDFYANAKINPLKKGLVSRIHEYSLMLLLGRVDPNTKSDWKVTLYKSMAANDLYSTLQSTKAESTEIESDGTERVSQTISKDKLIGSKTIEGSRDLSEKEIWVDIPSYIFGDQIVFFDKQNAQIVRVSDECLQVTCIRKLGTIIVSGALNQSLFIVTQERKIFKLTFMQDVCIEALQLQSVLPQETLSTSTTNNWRFIDLPDADSGESIPHAIFLRQNEFYVLPLEANKQGIRTLTREEDGTGLSLINRDWDIFTYPQGTDLATSILVYIFDTSMYFYDITNNRKSHCDIKIPGQAIHQKYKIMKVTIGRVYLYLETTFLSPASLIEVRYPENLDELFAESSIAIEYTKFNRDRLASDASAENVFIHIEGSYNKIMLIKFGEDEPIYQDEINCIYLVRLPLTNTDKQKQSNSAAVQASQPLKEEETKQENASGATMKLNILKKNSAQAGSKQTVIKDYNTALGDIRKQISTEATKVFKVEQDLLKDSRLLSSNPGVYWRNIQEHSQVDLKVKDSKLSETTTTLKEHLGVYKDLKDEKKKAARQREKEKGKKQKWENSNGEL